jgi:4-amino-4-deoxychorismate lyase
MILLNGEESDHITINDRGFQYGDGLFETIAVIKGRPIFLEQHLQRLVADCSKLNIPKPDLNLLADEVYFVSKQAKQAVLKIIITRGSGGRGYRQPDVIQPTRVISLYPFPEYPVAYAELGIKLRFCDTRLGLNPTLAGIKHLNRLEQIMARTEWDDPAIQEGIMLDINNHVIEGTMTNLFYAKGNEIFTASLHAAGVAGVTRAIIKNLIAEHDLSLIEHDFDREVLLSADEIFVCNSIIGIWPVKQIGNLQFAVGSLTKQIQTWLTYRKEKALANG